MSEIITNVRVITPDHWMKETDGKWYTHIPFECEENEDTLIEFIDSDEYIQEHKVDFDALNSGYTKKNVCIISADHKPTCNISIQVKKTADEPGRIMYNLKPDGTFEAEWVPDKSGGFDISSLLGGFTGMELSESDANKVKDAAKEIIL